MEDIRGRDEWTGGRWNRWDHGRNFCEWSSKVPGGDVRMFPGLPLTWSEYAWWTHKQVCSHVCVCVREKEKMYRRKKKKKKKKSLGYIGGRSGGEVPMGPQPPPSITFLRYTWHSAELCVSLLQLLNKGCERGEEKVKIKYCKKCILRQNII